jgi:hypothetical protein
MVSSIKGIIKNPAPFIDSYELPDQLDTLLLAVLEIMDIRLKKFNCTVKICKDGKALAKIGRRLFGQEMRSGGFYVMSFDTLYVDAESVTMHVLGHELSHAVQVHYFVVPPPVKLSEILSGYVEYQLRKYTQTLPE